MSSSRISWASCGSCAGARALTSSGPRMPGRRGKDGAGAGLFISVLASGLEFFEGGFAVLLFLELLDLELGVLLAGLADLEEFAAFLEFRQQLGQWHVARLHRLDDGLEFAEGGFEGQFAFFGFHTGKDATADVH